MNERQLIARVIAGDRLAGRALYDTHAPRVYSLAYRLSGDAEKARTILTKLENSTEYVSPGELAILYAGLGDKDGAFRSLEKGYVAHDSQLKYLTSDAAFNSLRSDPRFNDLVARVGLSHV